MKRINRIGVALKLAHSSHREILFGISQYAKKHHWQLQLLPIPEMYTREALTQAEASGLDGLITAESGGEDIASYLVHSKVPLLFIGAQHTHFRSRKSKIAFVHNDDLQIGDFGGRFLTGLGQFRSYGFLPSNTRNYCSILRQKGFANHIRGQSLPLFTYSNDSPDGTEADILAISRWIRDLPKPVAVMAAYDLRADHLIQAARRVNIHIPSQLSLLGVDNDELICDLADPAISSISPDYQRLGLLAARTLAGIMRNGRLALLQSHGLRIVERDSTTPSKPSAALVNRALSYIRQNATKGISGKDVVSHLGISRRLADLRFREAVGMSILEKITETKFKAVRSKLTCSNAPIRAITAACGFHNENHVKNLFKARYGITMSEFRSRHRPVPIKGKAKDSSAS